MTSEDEVERIIHGGGREDIRIGICQEIILEAEALDVPSRTPYTGLIGYPIGRLCRLAVEGRQLTLRIVLCEYPSVVVVANDTIGHGSGITQKHILPQVVADDAPI